MKKVNVRLIIEIIIIVLILVLSGVIASNVIVFDKRTPEEIEDQKVRDMLTELNDLIINGGTAKEIEELTGVEDIPARYLITGPDCYVALKPSNKIIDLH